MLKQRKVPMRKCTGCQAMKSKKELVRIVRDPYLLTAQERNPDGELTSAIRKNAWKRRFVIKGSSDPSRSPFPKS